MKTPELTELGLCHECEIWLEIESGTSWLPKHNKKGGRRECPDSRMSPWGHQYLVKITEEARHLANFIKNDEGVCLEREWHSRACGDGEDCATERLLFAKALAVYYLDNIQ